MTPTLARKNNPPTSAALFPIQRRENPNMPRLATRIVNTLGSLAVHSLTTPVVLKLTALIQLMSGGLRT
jgi:hypothetical protein